MKDIAILGTLQRILQHHCNTKNDAMHVATPRQEMLHNLQWPRHCNRRTLQSVLQRELQQYIVLLQRALQCYVTVNGAPHCYGRYRISLQQSYTNGSVGSLHSVIRRFCRFGNFDFPTTRCLLPVTGPICS